MRIFGDVYEYGDGLRGFEINVEWIVTELRLGHTTEKKIKIYVTEVMKRYNKKLKEKTDMMLKKLTKIMYTYKFIKWILTERSEGEMTEEEEKNRENFINHFVIYFLDSKTLGVFRQKYSQIPPMSKRVIEKYYDSYHEIMERECNIKVPYRYINWIEEKLYTKQSEELLTYLKYKHTTEMVLTSRIRWESNEFSGIGMKRKDKPLEYLMDRVECCNKDEAARFMVISLSLKSGDSRHRNILIYDKKHAMMDRFEPMSVKTAKKFKVVKADTILEKILSEKGIKYRTPRGYCPFLGPQGLQKGDKEDEPGRCIAWSVWYVDLRLRNPEIEPQKLQNRAMYKIRNNYTPYIRSYMYRAKTFNVLKTILGERVIEKLLKKRRSLDRFINIYAVLLFILLPYYIESKEKVKQNDMMIYINGKRVMVVNINKWKHMRRREYLERIRNMKLRYGKERMTIREMTKKINGYRFVNNLDIDKIEKYISKKIKRMAVIKNLYHMREVLKIE